MVYSRPPMSNQVFETSGTSSTSVSNIMPPTTEPPSAIQNIQMTSTAVYPFVAACNFDIRLQISGQLCQIGT